MAQFGKTTKPLQKRIKDNTITDQNGCWVWQKRIQWNGYAQICVGSRTDNSRKNVNAHRASYEAFVGPLKQGFHIDHLCRNRACVNPEHLEQVTPKENVHRSDAVYKRLMSKTRCIWGHAFTDKNTYIWPKSGHRTCKQCSRQRHRQYAKARTAAII